MLKIFPAIAANIVAAAAGIILMAASAWLITSASFHPPLSALAIGITLVRAAGLFKAIFRYLDRYLSHEIMFGALTQIQLKLYEKALKIFPLKESNAFEAQMLHELAVWANVAKDRFARVIQPLLSTALITIAVTAYLFKTIGTMALLLPFSMLLTITIALTFKEPEKVNDTAYRERLMDFFEGFEELNAAKSSEEAINKLDEAASDLKRVEQLKRTKTVNSDSFCVIVNTVLMVVVLKELAGKVDVIDLAMWLFILLITFEMFNSLPNAARSLFNAECEILSAESECAEIVSSESVAVDCALGIENLSFGYSAFKVLNDIQLEVKRGEKIAIIGESGSGKTTLLYLMLGLWQPDSGNILVNGSIAAATVNNYIFSQSVKENFLIIHPNITEEEMLRVLRICRLDNLNLDREIGENGKKISGGERNRLQTALALASNSDILILDEPTAGLDKITATEVIKSIIAETNEKDRTLIVITHDLSVAKSMDKIFKLYEGKIICED